MIEWIIFALSFILTFHWIRLKPKKFPPGPPVVPILGSFPFMETHNFHFYLERIREKYGPIIGFKFGTSLNAVGICGAEECLAALKKEEFAARPEVISADRGVQGVMFANGEHWRDQRRFTLRHLRDFGYGTSLVSDLVAQEVEEFCSKKLEGNKTVQASGLFNISAINILWAMMAGTRNSYDDPDFQELLLRLTKSFRQGNVTGGIRSIPYLKEFLSLFVELESDVTDRKLNEFFERSIKEHQATKQGESRDFIDAYLEELEKRNKKDSFQTLTLREICHDLFAAGTESSSNTLSFAILYLILYPEWQDKLYLEVKEALGGRPPRIDDKTKLPQVEAFIAEVERSNPVAALSIPRTVTTETTFYDYTLPKGTFLLISIWTLLQDKKHWGDPENFRPERHLNQDGKVFKDPYMVNFGAGPRICLGENLARNFVFLFLVSMIQRYKFSQPEGHPTPSTICDSGFTAAPKPFMVNIEKR